MDELMKRAIDGLDVDYAEIRLERSETTTLTYMGPVLETVGTVYTLGGCVRVCHRGGWGFAAFNRPEDAPESARQAARSATLTFAGSSHLAPAEPVVATVGNPVTVDPSDVPLEEKRNLLKRYNDIMRKAAGIVTTRSIYRDVKKTVHLVTSEGTDIEQEKIYTGARFEAIARDGTNVQRGHRTVGDRTGYDSVENADGDVEDAVKTARDLIRAPKVESGVYTVVLDPLLAGVFAHEAFGHLSEADFVYENPEALEIMTLGRRFGPDILSIVDDGTLESANGYTPYDDEGVPKGRTFLIREGVLVGRMHSRDTAGRMDEQPTGNARAIDAAFPPIVRMTNTFIENGETPVGEMIASVQKGVYAASYLGGMTDLERFTFSSQYAFRIENGRLTTPVRDVILSGNVFETLKNITMIGDDLTIFNGLGGCGKNSQSPLPVSLGSPHILVENVLIG